VSFSSLMDIDGLIPSQGSRQHHRRFSSLMDIDGLILAINSNGALFRFSSLMDIDGLILFGLPVLLSVVLVL